MQQYDTIKQDSETKKLDLNNSIDALKQIILPQLSEKIQPLTIQENNIEANIEAFILSKYNNFDNEYINNLKLLYGVKIVLLLSEFEDIVSEVSPLDTPPLSNLEFQEGQDQTNKENFMNLNLVAKKYKERISSIKNIINTIENNKNSIDRIIGEFIQSQAPNKDIDNCAIFGWKVTNRSSVAQRQKLISENVGEAYLNGIVETVNKLNNLVTNIDATLKGSLNDIITQYKEAINIFKQKLQTVLNIVNIGDNVFDDISSQEYKNLLTITEQRRLNPQHYMQYLKLNLEEAINILQEIDGGGDVTMEETKTSSGGGIGGSGICIAMTQMTNRKRKREGSPT